MHRRTLLKKAAALAVAVPVGAVALKAQQRGCDINTYPTCAAPEMPPPPPPDTRTPEQVIADQDAEILQGHIRHLTQDIDPWSKRWAYGTGDRMFAQLQIALQEQHIPFELRTILGDTCIIGSNGNIVRQITY